MRISSTIETRRIDTLRPHPEQASIFGDPTADPSFDELLKGLRQDGQQEALFIKADGTIIAGHARVAALRELGKVEALVRVVECDTYHDEVKQLIRTNTNRKHLMPHQIAAAFHKLRNMPKEDGGTKAKHGGDRKSKKAKDEQDQATQSLDLIRSADPSAEEAAEELGITKDQGRRLEEVFCKPDVPEAVKSVVDAGKVAASTAADTIKAERKRQGGEITDPAPLAAWAEQKSQPKGKAKAPDVEPEEDAQAAHERRVEAEAKAMREDMATLLDLYRSVDKVLSRRPLKSVVGVTEHHEYTGLIRDIALRCWGEIEQVQGQGEGSRHMRLVAINGGK